MEYNQFQVQEELPQKEFKKHPKIAIALFSISIACVIAAVVLTLLKGMEQLYSVFYAASLLTLILGFNCLMKFKGFCLIFYPIIVLYTIISAYAFTSDKSILEFQFPIIAASVILIYFIQSLYETLKQKDVKKIILPSIVLLAAVVLISLFTIIGPKLLGTIIGALIIPVMIYELIILIIEYKRNVYAPLPETPVKENNEDSNNE
jgi:hypothetical protein